MNNSTLIIQNIVRFIVLMLFQITVFNNVYLGGYINPFLYILFIIMLPTRMNKSYIITLSFLAGLCIDIFSNTLGFHAFCATLAGFSRIIFADKIITGNGDTEIDTPSIKSVSFYNFFVYSIIVTLVYNFSYYVLDFFTFQDLLQIIVHTILNSIITWLLIIGCQYLFMSRKKK